MGGAVALPVSPCGVALSLPRCGPVISVRLQAWGGAVRAMWDRMDHGACSRPPITSPRRDRFRSGTGIAEGARRRCAKPGDGRIQVRKLDGQRSRCTNSLPAAMIDGSDHCGAVMPTLTDQAFLGRVRWQPQASPRDGLHALEQVGAQGSGRGQFQILGQVPEERGGVHAEVGHDRLGGPTAEGRTTALRTRPPDSPERLPRSSPYLRRPCGARIHGPDLAAAVAARLPIEVMLDPRGRPPGRRGWVGRRIRQARRRVRHGAMPFRSSPVVAGTAAREQCTEWGRSSIGNVGACSAVTAGWASAAWNASATVSKQDTAVLSPSRSRAECRSAGSVS